LECGKQYLVTKKLTSSPQRRKDAKVRKENQETAQTGKSRFPATEIVE